MAEYTHIIGMRDLFMNPELRGILPQMDGLKLQNVYSFAEVEKRVQQYIVQVFGGESTGDGEIVINGKQPQVLARINQLKPLIEGFFNNMPKIVAGIRRNTPLYLPYASVAQLKAVKNVAAKIRAMKMVMDNFQYDDSLGATNSVLHEQDREYFARRQRAWKKRVGYRRLKEV